LPYVPPKSSRKITFFSVPFLRQILKPFCTRPTKKTLPALPARAAFLPLHRHFRKKMQQRNSLLHLLFFCKPCSLKPFLVAVALPLSTVFRGRCATAADRFPWPLCCRCQLFSMAVALPLPTVFRGRCAARCRPLSVAVALPLPTVFRGRCATAADRFPWPLRYRCRPFSVAVALPLPTVFRGRCAAAADCFSWLLRCDVAILASEHKISLKIQIFLRPVLFAKPADQLHSF
jgi:hypothetical protein